MKKALLLKAEPCPPPREQKGKDVLAVSQIIKAEGKDVLEIDLYRDATLWARYFASKDELKHVAWIKDGTWNSCKLGTIVEYVSNEGTLSLQAASYVAYCYYLDTTYGTKVDKETAEGYLENQVRWWENNIDTQKRQRAIERKRERIQRRTDEALCQIDEPALERWLRQQVFAGDYLFVKKEKGQSTYACTACGGKGSEQIQKGKWVPGEKTFCPACGHPVTVHRGDTAGLKREHVLAMCAYEREADRKDVLSGLPAREKVWAIIQYTAVCRAEADSGKTVRLYEEMLEIGAEGAGQGKCYYGQDRNGEIYEQEYYDRNPVQKRFYASYLYPEGLPEALACIGAGHSGLDLCAEKGIKIDGRKYLYLYRAAPQLEYLIKASLNRLTAETVKRCWALPGMMDRQSRTLPELLQLDGNRTHRLKAMDGGLSALCWLQEEQKTGKKIAQDVLSLLDREHIDPNDVDFLEHFKISVAKAAHYLQKQKTTQRTTYTWRDYLTMAEEEGYDMTEEIVLFPHDLELRHNQLVIKRQQEKDNERYAKINPRLQKHLPEAELYRYEEEGYRIDPAQCCEDLCRESQYLHHCVGTSTTYMSKMASCKSWILFLRRKEEPDVPYYTIEIDTATDRIIQYSSTLNQKPDLDRINVVLEHYKKYLKRRRREQEKEEQDGRLCADDLGGLADGQGAA